MALPNKEKKNIFTMRQLITALAAILILSGGWWGYNQLTAPDSSPRASAGGGGGARAMMGGRQGGANLNSTAPVVQSIPAEIDTLQPALNLFGQTRFSQTWQVTSEVTGRVNNIAVQAGQRVNAGDVLITLTARDLERQLAQVNAQIDNLNAQIRQHGLQADADQATLLLQQELLNLNEQALRRVQDLASRNLASASDVESARREVINQQQSVRSQSLTVGRQDDDLAQLEAELEALRQERLALTEDLEATQVRAPTDGLVELIEVQPGQSISTGGTLLTLQSIEPFQIRATLPATYIRLLDRENPLRGQMTWQGSETGLTLDSWGVTASDGGISVNFNLDNPSPPLVAGSFSNLTIFLPEERDVMSVPASSIYGNNRLYSITEDDRLQGHSVTIVGQDPGRQGEGFLVRAADIEPGAAILTTRLERPETGLRVLPLGRQATGQDDSWELNGIPTRPQGVEGNSR